MSFFATFYAAYISSFMSTDIPTERATIWTAQQPTIKTAYVSALKATNNAAIE